MDCAISNDIDLFELPNKRERPFVNLVEMTINNHIVGLRYWY